MIRTVTFGMLMLLGASVHLVEAQLTITEVMSSAFLETDPGPNRPDYWELTNYGTNDIDLEGFSFADNRQTNLLVSYPFTNLVIRAGESIVFFRCQLNRSSVTNAERFAAWWGVTNLPTDLQIRTWEDPGLNGEGGDEVWVYDPQLNVVDAVKFGEARTGRSFTYEPDSGVFGVFSIPGVNGAFRAELGGDVGSPGTTAGGTPLRLVTHPDDQTADAGASATFTVVGAGLPRPKYQWYANGLEIPGATAASLTISNVQPGNAGDYRARLHNGLSEVYSRTVALTVNTNPTAPTVMSPPADMTVFPRQTAVFSVAVRGFPSPQYQWQSNGVDLADAIQATLVVSDADLSMNPTLYTVRIWNGLGETNESAWLYVIPRPHLRFTEIMANPTNHDSSSHYDWFELTNFDTNAVNLQGYRFFDTPTFMGAFRITNSLILQPGESVVFVEEMTPEAFRNWWGAESVGTGTQIHTYHGFSLRELGEQLSLWNAAATDPLDTVATAEWAAALPGVSLECTNYCGVDEGFGCIAECLTDSIVGWNGASRSQSNGDIGSPGRLSNPPPRILCIYAEGTKMVLECRVTPRRNYRLMCTARLPGESWREVGASQASESLLRFEDTALGPEPTRFYRLEERP